MVPPIAKLASPGPRGAIAGVATVCDAELAALSSVACASCFAQPSSNRVADTKQVVSTRMCPPRGLFYCCTNDDACQLTMVALQSRLLTLSLTNNQGHSVTIRRIVSSYLVAC